jgi:predicted CXXCH cytochrome family protein
VQPRAIIGFACGGLVAVIGLTICLVAQTGNASSSESRSRATGPARGSSYLGSESCRECHEDQYATWKKSLHVQMTRPIAEARLAGDFSPGTRLEQNGRSYRMETRGGKYYISVAHGDRPPETFEVHYTLGAKRFQGYLSRLPDGRIYVLPVFWRVDARQWIDYAVIGPVPDGPHEYRQIWNFNCVNCHATNLAPNYSTDSNRYQTTWTEMGIGCEACHGPGSGHVTLMRTEPHIADAARASRTNDPAYGEKLRIFSPRTAPKRQVFDSCAYCHGNKKNLFLGFSAGDRYEDYALPFLVSEPIPENDPQGDYWPDGRPNRFNRPQALMTSGCFKSGTIACTDCHRMHGSENDHALKVPAARTDLLCVQCHKSIAAPGAGDRGPGAAEAPAAAASERRGPRRALFARWGARSESSRSAWGWGPTRIEKSGPAASDDPIAANDQTASRPINAGRPVSLDSAGVSAHTHHKADSPGSRCIECHMSDVNWRLLTRRRDHTFSPPVPEMTAAYGAPNPCTTCHDDRTPEWAAAVMDRWYGNRDRRRAVVATAEVMYRAGSGDAGAIPQLAEVAVDSRVGPVLRASAADFVAHLAEKQTSLDGSTRAIVLTRLARASTDPEAIVRAAATDALGALKDRRAVPALTARLSDSARTIRVGAAAALLQLNVGSLDGPAGGVLERAQEEYAASLRTFPDNARHHMLLAWLTASRGRSAESEADLRIAAKLAPDDPQPLMMLGGVLAEQSRFEEAIAVWTAAKKLAPDNAALERLIAETKRRLK